MEGLELHDILNGYKERMRRLALFDPLYELDRKREQDQNHKEIDMKGLGLLTLLFFFEEKLMREYKAGARQLAAFLEKASASQYQLDRSEYERLSRSIIQTFRPTTGKKRRYAFFNWETGEADGIDYSILKANSFEVKTNTQFYTLDEDGLELVFATKEFYSEFQLSINQLMLRKQLEKGEFKGALRQINEMRINVESLEERITRLKHEIQRSIVSEETFERYKQLLEDINERLKREDDEFKALRQFVEETRERLYSGDVQKKEARTYDLILTIARELESVHYDHSRLLKQTFNLKNTTLVTARESLYYTGIQAFNFDQDLAARIIATPLPPEAMTGVLQPFFRVEENRSWSPLAVFADQKMMEEREEREDQGFPEVIDEEGDPSYRRALAGKYKELMHLYLIADEAGEGRKLSQFLDFLEARGESEWFEKRYFYQFWLILHQRFPVRNEDKEDEEGKTILDQALALLGNRVMTVREGKGIVHKSERFAIQELLIDLEDDTDELS
ncbi:replicative DNA helicase [Sporolactobacillus sp. THM19-2]|uniref:replicative DNA helicase n=1 Tax=Sporolactobacillus sp. THM19-2 TaxID=2511171 RepID=UPI0010227D8D|nr:replicative DNA helicase [Sporolactobacillus sp. THM19-2]RYL91665.1 replicative DNA helicase [Sporolactobacillus sp. THM19-2]